MHTRTLFFALAALPVAVVVSAMLTTSGLSAQPAPEWDGSFSAAQAKRGEALYNAACTVCHFRGMVGSDRAPALAGAGFQARWKSKPLVQLLDYVQTQMPVQSPGGFSRRQNADLLAFMLQTNGSQPGQKDLWIEGADSGSPAQVRSADYGKVATPSTRRAERFYNEEQAQRGKVAWDRYCAFCHSVDPKLSTPADLLAALPSTFGGHFIERVVNGKVVYPNVTMLYSKLLSMPGYNTKAMSDQQRVDVIAYMLKMNGLPSGREEIPLNTDAMRVMMLNEPGFERLFNGKDFAGWNFVQGSYSCAAQPVGCSRTEPGPSVYVDNGAIVCECNIHGYFYTDKKYKDFTLRFEYKFERPAEFAPEDDEELYSGGTGYFIFSDVTTVYPRGIEIEGRHRDIAQYFAVGAGEGGEIDLEAKRRVMRPLGQWNTMEIVATKDGKVRTSLNGVLVSKLDKHAFTDPGHIVFQTQGRKISWRNIRIKAE